MYSRDCINSIKKIHQNVIDDFNGIVDCTLFMDDRCETLPLINCCLKHFGITVHAAYGYIMYIMLFINIYVL